MTITVPWSSAARRLGAMAMCAVAPVACGGRSANEMRASRVYLVAPAGSSPAAMYFVLANDGIRADTLLGVRTPAAEKAELHETVAMGPAADTGADAGGPSAAAAAAPTAPAIGMMTMVRSSPLMLPAHSNTRFAPGGRHVMLTSPRQGLTRGDTVGVTFVFTRRGELRARAVVISYADVDTATAAPPSPAP